VDGSAEGEMFHVRAEPVYRVEQRSIVTGRRG
jgi:hypothetical protein